MAATSAAAPQATVLADGQPKYTYLPLSRDKRSFRLLRVQNLEMDVRYEMVAYELQNAPRYDAVSYRWGDPAITHSIKVSGAILGVTESVSRLLNALVPSKGARYLWIDFVCINQDDSFEKDYQIPLMRDIYGNAKYVIAYVGDAPEGDAALIPDFLGKLLDAQTVLAHQIQSGGNRGVFPFKEHPEATRALQRLFANPYWQRAWIIQEVVIPTNVQMLYGGRRIDWRVFLSVVGGMRTVVDGTLLQLQDNWNEPDAWASSMRGTNCIGNMKHLRRLLHDDDRRLHLADIVMLSAQSVASHPQDKVYALLGLCSADFAQDPDMQPDHRLSPGQVFTRAVAHGLRGRKFSLLNLAGRCRPRTLSGLPSWVPDLSVAPITYPLDHPQTGYLAGGAAPAQFEVCDDGSRLRIRGVCIGRIKAVSALPPMASNARGLAESVLQLNDNEALLLSVAARHSEYRLLVEEHVNNVYSPNCQSREEALWRTLVGDEYPDPARYRFPAPDMVGNDYAVFRDLTELAEDVTRDVPTEQVQLRFLQLMARSGRSFARINGLMGRKINCRRLAVTKEGYLCLVLDGVAAGDWVCAFSGSKTPYLLRAREGEAATYELISEAYVHGFMQGEAMRQFERTWFDLV